MQHLKDRLHDHKLRHKKSKIEVKPEAAGDVKENVNNKAEAISDDKDALPARHPISVHNARMRIVAASKPSQQPPQDPSAPKKQPGINDLPPSLLNANRHMKIVASRNAPPVDGTAHQAATAVQSAKIRLATTGGDPTADTVAAKVLDLPPELLRAQQHMAIIASRKAAPPTDAKAVTSKEPNSLPMPVQRYKIRMVASPDPEVSSLPRKSNDLPLELAESQRHMEIMATRHAAASADAKSIVEGEATQMDTLSTQTKPTPSQPNSGSSEASPSSPQRNPPLPDPGSSPPQVNLPSAQSKPQQTNQPAPMVQKLQKRVVASQTSAEQKTSSAPSVPSGSDIIRYRYHHGANLGSIYVVEKWLTPSAFPSDTPDGQTSELSCVALCVKAVGVDGTRQKFENRWSKAMSEDDWKWLINDGHCTSIRLPIGYFTLGPDYCKGTPFEQYGEVYQNAWASVKQFVQTARKYGVGVLIDLHALPGGANTGDHSGTNMKTAGLWDNTANLDLATRCLQFIAHNVGGLDGLIGIQVCNEAVTDAEGMYDWWYDKVLAAISTIDPSLPLFISDAWDLAKAIEWIKSRNRTGKKQNPLVIDTHIYFCFDEKDKSCSPDQIIGNVSKTLSELDGKTGKVLDGGAAVAVVGEYSCTLDPETWKRLPGSDEEKAAKTKELGNTQCWRFAAAAGGAFFWTLKMDWMDGGDWGFVAQTKSGALCLPNYLTFSHDEVNGRTQNADSKRPNLRDAASKAHIDYWSKNTPKSKVAPEVYQQGWDIGWNDARAFFRCRNEGWLPIAGADKIGFKDLWVLKRINESGAPDASAWEFEQGIWKGMGDFEAVAFD